MTPPVRVAFVGRRARCWPHMFEQPTAEIEPAFAEADSGVLAGLDADVVVALDPDARAAAALRGVAGRSVAIVTGADATALDAFDATCFDRVVALHAELAQESGDRVWRSLAPPVNDALFAPVAPAAGLSFVALGRRTPRRARFLDDPEHALDLRVVDPAPVGQALVELFGASAIAVNVRETDEPAFELRVPMHLAAGHLVVTEPLAPLRGLEPGLDVLVARTPRELMAILGALRRMPDLHHRVRLRGRRKAEHFRASAVYARLVGDLQRDVAAFGSAR
jgi:hypothetical protein